MPITRTLPNADFLRLLQGRFDEKLSSKLFLSAISLKFGILVPALIVFALKHDAIPLRDWTADQWTAASMIPVSMLLGVWFFFYIGGEYEFTEHSIILRRRGIIVNHIVFEEIRSVEWTRDRHDHQTLVLSSERRRLIVFMFPELRNAVKQAQAQVAEWERELSEQDK